MSFLQLLRVGRTVFLCGGTLFSAAASCHAQLPSTAKTQVPFKKTQKLQGITFTVTTPNNKSINSLKIVPAGLSATNAPIVRDVEGTVTDAELGDLNTDGSPEIYVYVNSVGSGTYGSLVAYAANRKKSLSEIYLPDIKDDKNLSAGYRGHDQFTLGEGALLRRFPIYKSTDTNAKPTGGYRQIEYKLVPGEAGWLLKVKKSENRK